MSDRATETTLQNAADPAGRALRVHVVAGYPAVRAGLAALLARERDIEPVSVTPGPGLPTLSEANAERPDAIVADVQSVEPEVISTLEEAYPGTPLVLVGGNPAVDGPGLGTSPVAYLTQDVDATTLVAAVRGVASGLTVIEPALLIEAGIHAHARLGPETTATAGEPLTAREREVLEFVAAGLPNKTIARQLGISEHTVKFHVGSLLAKLGASSRTEAVMIATRRGLLPI
ncbi:MAG TPA: response regulator transcription factor [Thermomicrobiales bacterium]